VFIQCTSFLRLLSQSLINPSLLCVLQADPLGDVEKFIDMQMRPVKVLGKAPPANETNPSSEEEPPKLVKQYLVKWKTRSYLHCSWYDPIALLVSECNALWFPNLLGRLGLEIHCAPEHGVDLIFSWQGHCREPREGYEDICRSSNETESFSQAD
jgi:hypothetical protein